MAVWKIPAVETTQGFKLRAELEEFFGWREVGAMRSDGDRVLPRHGSAPVSRRDMITNHQLILHLSHLDPNLPVVLRFDVFSSASGAASADNESTLKHRPEFSNHAAMRLEDVSSVWDGDTHKVSVEISARVLLRVALEPNADIAFVGTTAIPVELPLAYSTPRPMKQAISAGTDAVSVTV
jgi:hypothetical protein